MLRPLTPYLLVGALVIVAAALGYELGGPAWLVYLALLIAALTIFPGYARWEERQHRDG